MDIKIQAIHFDADIKLKEYIQEKLGKLTHFYAHIVDAEVFLKLEKADNHENKVVEIKLDIPGKTLFADARDKTFEKAFDDSLEAISVQVKREKEKVRGL